MNIKCITCYRNNKVVLRVHCAINDETLKLMLKNKVIFYLNKDDFKSTEFIYLDNFDKVIIDEDYYSEMIEILKGE